MRIRHEDLERARLVKALIDKNRCRHHTYQELAQQVGTNVTKLQASFKTITGKNLYEYLTAIRIEEAMYLLETTELTIDAIAYKVGLDRTNLNKQFKKIVGISPSNWRSGQNKRSSLLTL